jgi:hypothetical protein
MLIFWPWVLKDRAFLDAPPGAKRFAPGKLSNPRCLAHCCEVFVLMKACLPNFVTHARRGSASRVEAPLSTGRIDLGAARDRQAYSERANPPRSTRRLVRHVTFGLEAEAYVRDCPRSRRLAGIASGNARPSRMTASTGGRGAQSPEICIGAPARRLSLFLPWSSTAWVLRFNRFLRPMPPGKS